MILEYAQLLSTAHRVLDGVLSTRIDFSGRKKTVYALADNRDTVLYSATHINHPSAVWVRQSAQNYMWLAELLEECCKEYTHRYDKVHKVERDGLMQALDGRWKSQDEEEPFIQDQINEQVEIRIKYQGYINRQAIEIERHAYYENLDLPDEIDYQQVTGLSNEVEQKLSAFRPKTLGQASRVSGVTPAAISLLLVHLKRGVGRKSPSL
jgi:tRNA U34 5-carboxymethylaminomethyl modifying enzyme MnmG/GidA